MREEDLIIALSSPEEFKRLVKDNIDLRGTAKQFPRYPIFNSASVDEAIIIIEKKIELNLVRDASSTLGQASRDPNSSLFKLPNEVLIKIAKHTKNSDKVSEKESDDAAHKVFNKPPKI